MLSVHISICKIRMKWGRFFILPQKCKIDLWKSVRHLMMVEQACNLSL